MDYQNHPLNSYYEESTGKKGIVGKKKSEKYATRKAQKRKLPFPKNFIEGKDYSFHKNVYSLDFEMISETSIVDYMNCAGSQLMIHSVPEVKDMTLESYQPPTPPNQQFLNQPTIDNVGDDNTSEFDDFQIGDEFDTGGSEDGEGDGEEEDFEHDVVLIQPFFTPDELNSPVSGSGSGPLHMSPIITAPPNINFGMNNNEGVNPEENQATGFSGDINFDDDLFLLDDPPDLPSNGSLVDGMNLSPFEDETTEEEVDETSSIVPPPQENLQWNQQQLQQPQPQPQQQQQQHYQPQRYQNNMNVNNYQDPSEQTRIYVRNPPNNQYQPQQVTPPPSTSRIYCRQQQPRGMMVRRRNNLGPAPRASPRPLISDLPSPSHSILTKRSKSAKVRMIECYQKVIDLTQQHFPWAAQGGIVLENCYDGVSNVKIDLGCQPLPQHVHVVWKLFRIGCIKGNDPAHFQIVLQEPQRLFGPKGDQRIFKSCTRKVKKKNRKKDGNVRYNMYFSNPRQEVTNDGILNIEYRLNNYKAKRTKGINLLKLEVYVSKKLVRSFGYYFKKDNRTEAKRHKLRETSCIQLENYDLSNIRPNQKFARATQCFVRNKNEGVEETKIMKKLSMFMARVSSMTQYLLEEIEELEKKMKKEEEEEEEEEDLKKKRKKKVCEKKLCHLRGQLMVFKKLMVSSSGAYLKMKDEVEGKNEK